MSLGLTTQIFLAALTGCLTSCAQELRASVQPSASGEYLLSYHPWSKMLDEYGRGTKNVRTEVRKAGSRAEIETIWQSAFADAARHYIEANSLIPTACQNGIAIRQSGQTEGGNGFTRFRCR